MKEEKDVVCCNKLVLRSKKEEKENHNVWFIETNNSGICRNLSECNERKIDKHGISESSECISP